MALRGEVKGQGHGSTFRIFRDGETRPLVVQNCPKGKRPFLHPIHAPDNIGGPLTEDAPAHHPWQHGLYTGLNDVNGIGFWTESEKDGTIKSVALRPWTFDRLSPEDVVSEDGWTLRPYTGLGERPRTEEITAWFVEAKWRTPKGAHGKTSPILAERQCWTLTDEGDALLLTMRWMLDAATDITFGRYDYGGLFLRMPFRPEVGGTLLTSEGAIRQSDAEAQRARWAAVSMQVEGRATPAGIAILDHPNNPEHPSHWRVDGQLGISPSRCISGAWSMENGKRAEFRYGVFVFDGEPDKGRIDDAWNRYASIDWSRIIRPWHVFTESWRENKRDLWEPYPNPGWLL